MIKIGITGSNGFVGADFMNYLKDENCLIYKDEKKSNILDLSLQELKSINYIIYCAYKFISPENYNYEN